MVADVDDDRTTIVIMTECDSTQRNATQWNATQCSGTQCSGMSERKSPAPPSDVVVGRITSRHVTSRHVTSRHVTSRHRPVRPPSRKKKKFPLFFPLFFYQSRRRPRRLFSRETERRRDGRTERRTERRTDGRRDRRTDRGDLFLDPPESKSIRFHVRYPIVRRCIYGHKNQPDTTRYDPIRKKKPLVVGATPDAHTHRGIDRSNRIDRIDPCVCGFFLRFGSGGICTVYTYSDETNEQKKTKPTHGSIRSIRSIRSIDPSFTGRRALRPTDMALGDATNAAPRSAPASAMKLASLRERYVRDAIDVCDTTRLTTRMRARGVIPESRRNGCVGTNENDVCVG